MKEIKIDPSSLRDRIVVFSYESDVNESGDTIEIEIIVVDTMSRKTEKTTFNQLVNVEGKQQTFVKRFHFDIRNRKGLEITENMYLLHKGLYYKILGTTELSRVPSYLKITTSSDTINKE